MIDPKAKIVARPMVVRACGHQQEFQHYDIDKYRAQRLAKFQATRCAGCVAKEAEAQRGTLTKGEALKRLPPGTQVSLTLQPNTSWAGTLSANGVTVEVTGVVDAGPQAVVAALARLWIAKSGSNPTL
jgi:hypothetical protein